MSRNQPAFETSTRQALDWRDLAACKDTDEPELWFSYPTETVAVQAAKEICWRCPVRGECDQFAEDTRMVEGIWGGLSEGERGIASSCPIQGETRRPVTGLLILLGAVWFGLKIRDRMPQPGQVEPGPLVFVLSVVAVTTGVLVSGVAWVLLGEPS